MGKKEVKTNAMRILERQKIPYTYETYECDEFTDGIETADKLGYEHQYVYKTLVTTGKAENIMSLSFRLKKKLTSKKRQKL